MRPPAPAASSPLTWALAAVFLVAMDAAVTRTSLLWGKSDLWVAGGMERMYIWHTYDVARKIYHPRREAPVRVTLLGNSRVWFPARDAYVERELRRLAPDLDVRVDNLAIFGARIGDMEIISRHLHHLDPDLVVITLNGADLVPTSWGQLVNPTGELLDIGWRDGPLPPESHAARIDRWVRTAWPLYRFRRFAREVAADRLFPVPGDGHFPDRLASRKEYFDFMYGERRGPKVRAAYRVWLRERTLSAFIRYIGPDRMGFGLTEAVPEPESLTHESPGVAMLDHLLQRLGDERWSSFVLLMPENPLLEADTEGRYHRPGFSDRAAALIRQVADRHGVRVVDGRQWMPADRFVDFVHVFPDWSGFQLPLAEEVLHALAS